MSICTKMKTNRVHTSLLPHLGLSYVIIIAFHLCGLNNMKWIPSSNGVTGDWTLQQTLQNQRRTTNIFGFWIFEARTEKTLNKAKYFWIFQISNRKLQVKQTKARKLKRQTKRNNGNIFGLFVFRKVEIRTRTIKKRKRNMDIQSTDKIWYVDECIVGVPSPKLRLLA
jgi:hypothetical protein